jgi:hypothetical protein
VGLFYRHRVVKVREILNRLSGFSTPLGGVQWDPPALEIEAARRTLSYLEDRRVLYAPSSVEIPEHCIQSVLGIREHLTHELGQLRGDDLGPHLRAMRAACRKFLNALQALDARFDMLGSYMGFPEWVFLTALGELRGIFGVQIGQIAAMFNLDVEEPLAAILPIVDDNSDGIDH